MSLTIDASVGGAASNSFVTETEAIAYMAARLNASSWTSITGTTCTETEKAALIEATRELTSLSWEGRRVNDSQALSWPRTTAVNPDSAVHSYFSVTVIPQRVKDACVELAFQFIKAGTTDIAALDSLQAVTEKTVDVLTTRYAPYARAQGLARFPRVLNDIRPLLSSSGMNTPTVRG